MNSWLFHQDGMKKRRVGGEEMKADWCRKQIRGAVIFAME